MAQLIPGDYTDRDVLAIDTKKHLREWYSNGVHYSFKGILAFGIITDNINKFEDDYMRIRDDLFEEFNISLKNKIIKATKIYKYFHGDPKTAAIFLNKFAHEVFKLDYLQFYLPFLHINSNKLKNKSIRCYYEYGSATKDLSVSEFINTIWPWCDIIFSWKIINKFKIHSNPIVLLDGLQYIQHCNIWEQYKKQCVPQIIFSGDSVNHLLSTCDIIVRCIDTTIHEKRLRLFERDLQKALNILAGDLGSKCKIIYTGNPDLANITPRIKQPIPPENLKDCIRHPIIFIGKESTRNLRRIIEDTPRYTDILNFAVKIDGGIKHYDSNFDAKYIGTSRNTDFFVPLSNASDEELEMLTRMGNNIEKLDPRDL